jgi:glucan biosynthesis protein C
MNASGRLHHLDFLRASLMFLGVLVHASHADYDLGTFEPVRFLSGSFRMACFFLISGYFAPSLLERYGASQFLRKRLLLLAVPAVFCSIVLNPFALHAMRHYLATAPTRVAVALNWHLHVWFLFALMLYTCLSIPLVLATRTVCQHSDRARSAARAEWPWMLVITLSSAIALKAFEKWAPLLPGYFQYKEICEPALEDFPYFAFGVLMSESPRSFDFAHRRPGLWAPIALALLGARALYEPHAITSTSEHLLHLGLGYATAFACSFALLGLTQRYVTEPRRWVRLTSESAYTVYIVHYLIIAVSLCIAQGWDLSIAGRAAFAASTALAGGLAIHFWGVRSSALVALLLNGRMQAARLPELPRTAVVAARPTRPRPLG